MGLSTFETSCDVSIYCYSDIWQPGVQTEVAQAKVVACTSPMHRSTDYCGPTRLSVLETMAANRLRLVRKRLIPGAR
jgi:hypothetical protein